MTYIKKKGRFTVREVIEILKKVDQDREVVCAVDAEWNEIKDMGIEVSEFKEVVFFPLT